MALLPGETRTVGIDLDWDAFAYYQGTAARWVVEPVSFTIMVDRLSADIRLQQ